MDEAYLASLLGTLGAAGAAPGWGQSTQFPWLQSPAAFPPASGAPLDINSPAQTAMAQGSLPTGARPDPNALANALRGVQAPAPPVAQKIATPHAPALAKIQGNQLASLLASLGVAPQLPKLGGRV